MRDFKCRAGDILFYDKATSITEKAIEYGESRVDGYHKRYVYHVAVALNDSVKVEALNETVVDKIDYSTCIVCRPPYHDEQQLRKALRWLRTLEGRPYGWIGVFDQALRDLTKNRLHLPKRFIEWIDSVTPFCSVESNAFLRRAGYREIPQYPPPDPQKVWLKLRRHKVYDYKWHEAGAAK